jgi:hypothetical protein
MTRATAELHRCRRHVVCTRYNTLSLPHQAAIQQDMKALCHVYTILDATLTFQKFLIEQPPKPHTRKPWPAFRRSVHRRATCIPSSQPMGRLASLQYTQQSLWCRASMSVHCQARQPVHTLVAMLPGCKHAGATTQQAASILGHTQTPCVPDQLKSGETAAPNRTAASTQSTKHSTRRSRQATRVCRH